MVEETLKCRRCGKRLKNKDSMKLGLGPVCYKKFISECNSKKLFKLEGGKDEFSGNTLDND